MKGLTERQLRIWVKLIQKEIEKYNEALNHIDLLESPAKYGALKGNRDGLAQAWTWLEIVETGKRFKNRIADIEMEIDEEDRLSEDA